MCRPVSTGKMTNARCLDETLRTRRRAGLRRLLEEERRQERGDQQQHREEVKRLRLWNGRREIDGRTGVAGPGTERRMRHASGVMMG